MKTKIFTIRIPVDLMQKYTEIAINKKKKKKRIIPLSEIIIEALYNNLNKNENVL